MEHGDFDPFTSPNPVAVDTVCERDRVAVGGAVTGLDVQPWAGGSQALRVTVTDETGDFTVAFLGRAGIAGVELGRQLVVGGTVIRRRGRLMMMNPHLWLQPAASADKARLQPKAEAFV